MQRIIPLPNVTRENTEPSKILPPLGPKNLHSEKCSSIEKGTIEHKSHDQSLFNNNSVSENYYLEETTRSV